MKTILKHYGATFIIHTLVKSISIHFASTEPHVNFDPTPMATRNIATLATKLIILPKVLRDISFIHPHAQLRNSEGAFFLRRQLSKVCTQLRISFPSHPHKMSARLTVHSVPIKSHPHKMPARQTTWHWSKSHPHKMSARLHYYIFNKLSTHLSTYQLNLFIFSTIIQ